MPNRKSKLRRLAEARKMAAGQINLAVGVWVQANSNRDGSMAKNGVSGAAHKRIDV